LEQVNAIDKLNELRSLPRKRSGLQSWADENIADKGSRGYGNWDRSGTKKTCIISTSSKMDRKEKREKLDWPGFEL
jgi:hypothetical protein